MTSAPTISEFRPGRCIKIDLKNDGAQPSLRETLLQDPRLFPHLYREFVESNEYDVIVFSEVRGDMSLLKAYGETHRFQYYQTAVDQQGFDSLCFTGT